MRVHLAYGERGLIVGAAFAGGALASVATRFIGRPELSAIVALVLATALAALAPGHTPPPEVLCTTGGW